MSIYNLNYFSLRTNGSSSRSQRYSSNIKDCLYVSSRIWNLFWSYL